MMTSSPQPATEPGTAAVRVTHDDPRVTTYQVLVVDADSLPLAACVVTCSHEPGDDVWTGACEQWRHWGTCPHVALAQRWQQHGRPGDATAATPLDELRRRRREIKQLLPRSRVKPGPRKWRPTITKTQDRRAQLRLAEDVADRTAPARLRGNLPGAKPPGHQQWREFNQQTATKYKLEMPGHECPHGWHAGPDGKCYPKGKEHVQQHQQESQAHPSNPAAQHDLALAHLAGGEIESSTPLDPSQSGINTAHLVKIKGDGTGLYKSQAGAAAFQHPDDVQNMRALAPATRYDIEQRIANQHRHEALFYDLERRYFGTHLTPPTTVRADSAGKEGSIQQFVPGAQSANAIPPAQLQHLVATDPCLKRSLEDLTALDIFGGHQDRRAPNLLIRHDPQRNCHEAVAIDNGFSSGTPTLGGHHHMGYDLGVSQLQPRHVQAAQRVMAGGLAPLIARTRAVGLHPNVGKQHYLNALFMATALTDQPFKREALSQRYLEFLDHTSEDQTQPHEVRAAAQEALLGGLPPYDPKQRNQVVQQWEQAAAVAQAEQRRQHERQMEQDRGGEDPLEFSRRIEREMREKRKPSPAPPAVEPEKYRGHEALSPTRLVTPAAVTAASQDVVVAVLQVGRAAPLARYTLDEHGRLTVDNADFVAELHRTPYHYSGAGKLWTIVQRNAHNSYQHLVFTSGSLAQLHDRVPAAERRVVLAPAVQATQDFEAARQAYLRRKQGH